ncbi:MAG: peroxiredoxin [Bdellovibrionales bacterium]|nr:peroxiredoxin [Bdellovibrionales bacterium]
MGQLVPDFSLSATGAKQFQLSAMKGKKIVLYFYPKDATPGCTIEGHDFTKLHNEFKSKNAEVYGVSRDSISSHEKFKDKQCYSIDLISDPEEKICRTFGVIKTKNMYGKKVLGIERSTFVIDENGQLEKEWRGVSVEGHAQEVLDYLGSKKQ